MNLKKKYILLWVIFALLDPDPDSEYGSGSTDPIEYGSNPDPDPVPQPWAQPGRKTRKLAVHRDKNTMEKTIRGCGLTERGFRTKVATHSKLQKPPTIEFLQKVTFFVTFSHLRLCPLN
jgi:hypothetical protein